MEENENIKVDKKDFILITKDSLTDYYNIIRMIGEGGFGKVYEVQNVKTSETYACKKISKTNILNYEHFKNEINIMSKADHPHIIKLYEIYESNRSFYLIMELCKGGQLFHKIIEKIQNKKMYTEKDAAEIFQQIISGIEYCHNQGICHRDLKPENILYLNNNNEKNNPLKIIDFGFSKHFKSNKFSSRVGSTNYVSPEVLSQSYTEKCDIWSAGVILFLLLSGTFPFSGSDDRELFAKIKSINYNMDGDLWKNISDDAKDLIRHMLVNESERYSAKEVLSHPWFKIINNKNNKILNIDFNLFKKYSQENTLKKIVLYFIATRLNEKEINELSNLFKNFDTDLNGQISYEEFEKGIFEIEKKSNSINQNEIKDIFENVDINKNGKIDYTEFIAACLEGRKEIVEKRLYEAFSSYDKEEKGKISKEDFMKALHIDINLNEKGFEKIINDLIKDDLIDYNEFMKLINQ